MCWNRDTQITGLSQNQTHQETVKWVRILSSKLWPKSFLQFLQLSLKREDGTKPEKSWDGSKYWNFWHDSDLKFSGVRLVFLDQSCPCIYSSNSLSDSYLAFFSTDEGAHVVSFWIAQDSLYDTSWMVM